MSPFPALWRRLVDGFWFVPGAIAISLSLLAFLALEADRRLEVDGLAFAFGGDADAARNVLSTIAGSLITVAGLTFSITIVVLTLVSSQYTPRAVRGFLADRLNQAVAGAFVGIFAYCLIVLGAVRSEEAAFRFVPVVSVSVSLLLALTALALLVVFVHHMGQNIQASNIAARIGRETLRAVERLYPEQFGEPGGEDPGATVERWRSAEEPGVVTGTRAGFVQLISIEGIKSCLETRPLRVHVPVRPGEFVTPETRLVEVWPRASVDRGSADRIRAQVTIGSERDVRQDAAYGFRQLADIALKALSPGVNDPTTAVEALGHSIAGLERLARRSIPSPVRRGADEQVVLVVAQADFAGFVETALGEIAHYAAANPRVVIEALNGLARVADAAEQVGADERLEILATMADEIAAHARDSAETQRERERVDDALRRVSAGGRAASNG